MKYVPPIDGDQTDPERGYVNANPTNAVAGSIPPAAAFEHPQREILKVITEAGLIPDTANLTQLHEAIQEMIASAQITEHDHDDTYYPRQEVYSKNFPQHAQELGESVDLNTLTEPGFYYQRFNSSAESGSNYPEDRAGSITVTLNNGANGANGVNQIYQTYNDGTPEFFFRSFHISSWSPWRRLLWEGIAEPIFHSLIKLLDAGQNGGANFWLHANDGQFFILTDRDGVGGWDGPYPAIFDNSQEHLLIYGKTALTEANVYRYTGRPHASITAEFANGLHGGGLTRGVWGVRPFNTEYDSNGLITLSNNAFTPNSNAYMTGWGLIHDSGLTAHRIYCVTDDVVIGVGSGGQSHPTYPSSTYGFWSAEIEAGKTYRIEMRCTDNNSSPWAFGRAKNFGQTELFAQIDFWRR